MNDKKVELQTISMSNEEFESHQINVLKSLEGLSASSAKHVLENAIKKVDFHSSLSLIFRESEENYEDDESSFMKNLKNHLNHVQSL